MLSSNLSNLQFTCPQCNQSNGRIMYNGKDYNARCNCPDGYYTFANSLREIVEKVSDQGIKIICKTCNEEIKVESGNVKYTCDCSE